MQEDEVEPKQHTFSSVLPACANLAALEHGRRIHECVVRGGFQSNVFVASALVDMYIKCGCLDFAREVFDQMTERNVVSWNSMVTGYAESGGVDEALEMFQRMPWRDVVSWSAVIAGCAQSGKCDKALKLFREMQSMQVEINSDTFTSILPACASLGALNLGREVHLNIIRNGFQGNLFVGSALVDMYAKCRSVEEAQKVFDQMPQRNVFTWNSVIAGYAEDGDIEFFEEMNARNVVLWTIMIAGYVHNGHFDKAISLFQEMQFTGMRPDPDIFATVLPACASLAALGRGSEIHEHIIRCGFHLNIFVADSLIDMYAKCGSREDAFKVFDKMPIRNVVSYTTMIVGYATHGCGKEALQIFQQMQRCHIKPDALIFLGVLYACCHAGLVEEGWQYFNCMTHDYQISPELDHYSCMVDMLGRAEQL